MTIKDRLLEKLERKIDACINKKELYKCLAEEGIIIFHKKIEESEQLETDFPHSGDEIIHLDTRDANNICISDGTTIVTEVLEDYERLDNYPVALDYNNKYKIDLYDDQGKLITSNYYLAVKGDNGRVVVIQSRSRNFDIASRIIQEYYKAGSDGEKHPLREDNGKYEKALVALDTRDARRATLHYSGGRAITDYKFDDEEREERHLRLLDFNDIYHITLYDDAYKLITDNYYLAVKGEKQGVVVLRSRDRNFNTGVRIVEGHGVVKEQVKKYQRTVW